MDKLRSKLRKNRTPLLLLLVIILIGIFLRAYHLVPRFEYAHDGDLYGWFVKDVVVDHHIRLIGQLTSAPGIFIGPAFYYALIPFFLLFSMDPVGGNYLVLLIAVLTFLSYFYVFNKLFNSKVALIITFLQAVLLYHANFDRAVVPTTPTHLWAVWYFYCLARISQAKFKYSLPLLGFLIGYIWHLHVALLPAFLALPLAFILAKKIPTLKQISYFLITLIITSLPLLLFEVRHNFSQTHSFFANFSQDHGGLKGGEKLQHVLLMIAKNLNNLFLYPISTSPNFQIILTLTLFALSALLTFKKIFPRKIALLSLVWVVGMVLFFTLSSTPISEYYFANFEIIFLLAVALLLSTILKLKFGKYLLGSLLAVILIYNLHGLFKWTDPVAGYISRKAAIDFIRDDMAKNDYPCISLGYVTIVGENVGFRYFLWHNNIKVVNISDAIPRYQIALPAGLSDEVTFKNGLVGVIPPSNNYQKPSNLKELCEPLPDLNVTESMFGFVK